MENTNVNVKDVENILQYHKSKMVNDIHRMETIPFTHRDTKWRIKYNSIKILVDEVDTLCNNVDRVYNDKIYM